MNADTNTRLRWAPPFIAPHRSDISKHSRRMRESASDNIEGHQIEALTARYGSPLFIASERRLRDNIRRIRGAFESRYSPVIHGWSYKTNYLSAVCNILAQEGSWAEVVSAFEYEKARWLGVPGERIIFNGPNKSRAILERAISDGARLHVDHLDELDLIEQIARERGVVVPLAIRINLSTGYTDPWSRFGFNLESGQAHSAATRVNRSSHLSLSGLHCHIGTFVLEPRAYGEQVRLMCAFMKEVEADGACVIDTLDIGGGLPSRNALQGILLPPEQAVPPIEDFARAVCDALDAGLAGRLAPRPTLIFESGRAVVDDAFSLATTVVGTKRLPDGRAAAVLDGGLSIMLSALWYHFPVRLTKPKPGLPEETALYGPMCMNIDVMRHSVMLPPLAVGDQLVFNPVGAYNNTQSMQFIEYRPAIVLIHEDGGHSVIREAENLADMCRHDRLPPHLTSCEPRGGR
jgi:diaminopimelate decarboxylase